jgi:hypothetical protein
MTDDLRPKGSVEVECIMCGWTFWVDCLDKRLPEGPFVCPTCEHGPAPILKDPRSDH